jgi:uncharacterized protein with von Willebrand factor type A (vWA) domain
MFLDFFYNLRARGVKVSTHDWLALMDALGQGLHGDSLDGFYQVARCLAVTSETQYDAFDLAFAETFRGVQVDAAALIGQLDDWLANPARLAGLDEATRRAMEGLDMAALRELLLQRLREQKERHEGGNRWIGTGGTSPFGQGGAHPTGIRIGGEGGGRSALAVADARRFRAYRSDLVLDVRQIAAALRRLRDMGRTGQPEELDIDASVDETARNAGELEIVLRPPRKNDLKVLLLMDVGGSMDPYARLCSRLFSAASQAGSFKELRHYYFHNTPYAKLYRNAEFTRSQPTAEVIRELDPTWRLIVVGDAYMHPGELMMASGNWYTGHSGPTGITWLARLAGRFPRAAWLNPEAQHVWDAPTIAEIRRVYEMFPLTLEGLDAMVRHLRRPPSPQRTATIHALSLADDLVPARG